MTTSEDFNFHRKARPHQGQGPKKKLLASLITPIHNGREFLEEMLVSVLAQTYRPLELVAADDASSDGSLQVLESWRPKFDAACIDLVLIRMEPLDLSNPRGCGAGHARNRAVKASSGMWLINMDCDDICACPQRVEKLVSVLEKKPGTLVGSNFVRIPSDSTPFYTLWCNSLSQRGIFLEQYRECTLICPTWGYSRQLFDDLNGYMEAKAEDLDFFLRHLERGGDLVKVEQPLVYYR
jgi:glycosyltransferase involved in cell wall biosynthesis